MLRGPEAINNSFFHRFICMQHVLSNPSKVVIFFRPCSNRSDLVAVIDVQHFVSTVQRSGHDP